MIHKFNCRSELELHQPKPLLFFGGGDILLLCLFLLLGKQVRIKMEGVALKSSVFVDPWLHPVCVVLKRASVSHWEEYSASYKWL